MKNIDIIRAWKDEEYRKTLSSEELAKLPANPAGLVDLDDDEMRAAAGGATLFLAGGSSYTFICHGPACSAAGGCKIAYRG